MKPQNYWDGFSPLSPDEIMDVDGGGRARRTQSRSSGGKSKTRASARKKTTRASSRSVASTRNAPKSRRAETTVRKAPIAKRVATGVRRLVGRGSGETNDDRGRSGNGGLFRGNVLDQTAFENHFGFRGNQSCLTTAIANLFRNAPGGFTEGELESFVNQSIADRSINPADGSPYIFNTTSMNAAIASGSNVYYEAAATSDGRLATISVDQYRREMKNGSDIGAVIFRLENDNGSTHFVVGNYGSKSLTYVDSLDPNRRSAGGRRIQDSYHVAAVIPLTAHRR